MKSTLLMLLISFLLCSNPARADIPSKVTRPASVMLKTTLFGTAAGAVLGLGGMAVLGGGAKTFGQVTSIGMYTGILMGIYILVAPPEFIYGTPSEKAPEPSEEARSLVPRNSPLVARGPAFWTSIYQFEF